MFARLLVLVVLLSCSGLIVRAEPVLARGTTVGVYLQEGASASSLSLEAMRLELRDLIAPTGLNLVWTKGSGTARVDELIVVELRGTCQPGHKKSRLFRDHSALAFTAVTDGKVLPFSWVDCAALAQFLGASLEGKPAREQAEIYGRAMARLLAHEFYHVLLSTESHTETGISKTSFTVSDLLAKSFTFHERALAQFQQDQPAAIAPAVIAEGTEAFDGSGDSFEVAFGAGR